MSDLLILTIGIIGAGIGGELFVRGLVGVAGFLRVSAGIVAVTFAAFATSSPELAVGIGAALSGKPQISLGDVLGSSIINVALVLGLMLAIWGMQSRRESIKRDYLVSAGAPLTLGFLMFDGVLSRWDGLLLLAVFFYWVSAVVMEARKQRNAAEQVPGNWQGWASVVYSLSGLVLLVVSAQYVVQGAKGIAFYLGIGEFIVGAVIVAVGTSIPELATVVISRWRKHEGVGLGTILGSNIFNSYFIIAIVAIIFPIAIDRREVMTTLAFGLATVALVFPSRNGRIGRGRGLLLLALYIFYVILIFP